MISILTEMCVNGKISTGREVVIMKSPYEVESKTIAISFVIAFIILIAIALVFHKELLSFLVSIITVK